MSHPGVEPCRLEVPLGFFSILSAPLTFLSLCADKWAMSSFNLQLFKEAQTCDVELINICPSVCKIIYKGNKPVKKPYMLLWSVVTQSWIQPDQIKFQ